MRKGSAMKKIEFYKLAGAVLVAALVVQVVRVVGDRLVSPEESAPATVATAPQETTPPAAREAATPAAPQAPAAEQAPPQESAAAAPEAAPQAASEAATEAATGAATEAATASKAMSEAAAPTLSAGDAEAGKAVFKKHLCFGCHKLKPGKHGVGPSLAGVVGRKAGEAEGYKYSKALKESGIVWNEENLDKWLQGPKKMVKGTKMILAKPVKDAKDRADLIAYLKKASGT